MKRKGATTFIKKASLYRTPVDFTVPNLTVSVLITACIIARQSENARRFKFCRSIPKNNDVHFDKNVLNYKRCSG